MAESGLGSSAGRALRENSQMSFVRIEPEPRSQPLAHPSQGLPYAIRVYGLSAEGVRPTLSPVSTPTPDATVYAAGWPETREGTRPLIARLWPASEVERMLDVANCESTYRDVQHYGGEDWYGRLQVDLSAHRDRMIRLGYQGTAAELLDWEINAVVAHDIWKEQGIGPWGCRP